VLHLVLPVRVRVVCAERLRACRLRLGVPPALGLRCMSALLVEGAYGGSLGERSSGPLLLSKEWRWWESENGNENESERVGAGGEMKEGGNEMKKTGRIYKERKKNGKYQTEAMHMQWRRWVIGQGETRSCDTHQGAAGGGVRGVSVSVRVHASLVMHGMHRLSPIGANSIPMHRIQSTSLCPSFHWKQRTGLDYALHTHTFALMLTSCESVQAVFCVFNTSPWD